MQLSYRGIPYEKKSSVIDCYEGEVGGKYRGCDWHFHYARPIPQLQTKTYRQYKNTVYISNPRAISTMEAIPRSSPIEVRKPTKVFIDETRKIHLESIRRNLERRLQVARANNNNYLIDLLEKEFNQLGISKNSFLVEKEYDNS